MANVLPPLREPAAATIMNTTLNPTKNAAFPLSNWGGVQTMVTSYSMDYGKKERTPSEARPCSATRRNRPHPSRVSRVFDLVGRGSDLNKQCFLIEVGFQFVKISCKTCLSKSSVKLAFSKTRQSVKTKLSITFHKNKQLVLYKQYNWQLHFSNGIHVCIYIYNIYK